MKKIQLNQGILGGLLLVAAVANAQEYPAADFQPKVLFQDESVVNEVQTNTSDSAQAPCVNNQSADVKKDVVAEVDPNYPASSFQPKVIFSEAN